MNRLSLVKNCCLKYSIALALCGPARKLLLGWTVWRWCRLLFEISVSKLKCARLIVMFDDSCLLRDFLLVMLSTPLFSNHLISETGKSFQFRRSLFGIRCVQWLCGNVCGHFNRLFGEWAARAFVWEQTITWYWASSTRRVMNADNKSITVKPNGRWCRSIAVKYAFRGAK